ncbi:MAG: hypothetical protein IT335_09205 [Thermomicrobiales bacterium]|nr:hypothetical protein [Thermomicrobiales bacterium]
MDGNRFDRLTRSLAAGASRRQVIKGFLGLGGATVAGGLVADVDARDARTRPTIPPPPEPATTTTSTTPAPLCGPGQAQCPNSTLCCDAGACARSGNRAICCDSAASVCGLECCDDPLQCCDRECCGDLAVCLNQVFSGLPEEICCPGDLTCDGGCCNGECFMPEGPPFVINGFPIPAVAFARECCPPSSTVCQGESNATCCDDATQQCCLRDGVAICIAAGACCDDGNCPDPCSTCLNDACVFDCADGGAETCCTNAGACGDPVCNPDGSCSYVANPSECPGACEECVAGSGNQGAYICQPVPASAGSVCRPSTHDYCDPAEVCDGQNITCPADQRKPDGEYCNTCRTCQGGDCLPRPAGEDDGECGLCQTCDGSGNCRNRTDGPAPSPSSDWCCGGTLYFNGNCCVNDDCEDVSDCLVNTCNQQTHTCAGPVDTCVDPPNGTSSCGGEGCEITCDAGYELNDDGQCQDECSFHGGWTFANGTCAKRCSEPGHCAVCPGSGCSGFGLLNGDQRNICWTPGQATNTACSSDLDCPEGQLCNLAFLTPVCMPVCNPIPA